MIRKAVITGGTGMLGLALIRLLIKNKIEIAVICRPGSKRLERIPKNALIKIVECEINNLGSLSDVLDSGYDAFFHFAWDGTYGENRNNMFLQNKNIKAALDSVNLAASLGCKVWLGAGSQAEYGRVEGKLSPLTPAYPENGYGMAKLCAGQMTRIMCQKNGIRHIWSRILSTFGPYDGNHTMVMSGIRQMLSGESPKYTQGEQMWDYLYCDDAARAFYLAAEKGRDGAVYCIGSGVVKPLKEYIITIRDIVKPYCHIEFGGIPYYENQVMYLCADITNLTEDTGFIPEVSFEDGIKRTLDWYRKDFAE